MTKEQFEDIKKKAWNWYRGNMLEWVIKTLKDIENAPDWVKNYVREVKKFDGVEFEASLDDEDFLKQYEDEIKTLLVASQELNFEINFSEEQREFYKAMRDKNEYKIVDAICDMCIISMNAGLEYREGVIEKLSIIEAIHLHHIIPSNVISYRNIGYIIALLQLRGYDPYKCLLETIKELETRTGAWNDEEGKWCKALGAYTIEEALKKAEDEMECGFTLSLCLLKEDNDFWLIGDDDEEFDEEQSLDEIKHEFLGHCVKVKKWYKADYEKCEIENKESVK